MKITETQKGRIRAELGRGVIAVIIFTFVFGSYLLKTPLSMGVTLVTLLVFIILNSAYILQINPPAIKAYRPLLLSGWRNVLTLPATLYLVALIYAGLTGQFQPVWALFGIFYVLVPTSLVYQVRERDLVTWQDILALVLLWLPVELGILNQVTLPMVNSVISIFHLMAIILLIYLFIIVRAVPDTGLALHFKGKDTERAIWYYVLFVAIIGIPVGFFLGLLSVPKDMPDTIEIISTIFFITFFIAVPEEVLYRGIIQNLLEKKFKARPNGVWLAIAISSILFGISYLNNTRAPLFTINLNGVDLQIPWVYFIFSTAAGVFYGIAYTKTRKVTVAIVVHALVDIPLFLFLSNR